MLHIVKGSIFYDKLNLAFENYFENNEATAVSHSRQSDWHFIHIN
jgi:hypothetical protein